MHIERECLAVFTFAKLGYFVKQFFHYFFTTQILGAGLRSLWLVYTLRIKSKYTNTHVHPYVHTYQVSTDRNISCIEVTKYVAHDLSKLCKKWKKVLKPWNNFWLEDNWHCKAKEWVIVPNYLIGTLFEIFCQKCFDDCSILRTLPSFKWKYFCFNELPRLASAIQNFQLNCFLC